MKLNRFFCPPLFRKRPIVRQEVSNLDSSVVVHELELAINRALYGFFVQFR